MKKISALIVFLLILGYLHSQDCKGYFPLKKGTFLESRSYDAKDKLTGIGRQTILDLVSTGSSLSIKVNSEQLDEKEKVLGNTELTMRCEEGVFYMDMNSFVDPKSKESFKDGEIAVEGVDLSFPSVMQVGQTLPDGDITFRLTTSAIPMTLLSVKIVNRKVEGIENITTAAGTFECFKVSYDVELKALMKISSRAIQWVAKDVGAVRTESYNKSGKLTGYTVLTQFSR